MLQVNTENHSAPSSVSTQYVLPFTNPTTHPIVPTQLYETTGSPISEKKDTRTGNLT